MKRYAQLILPTVLALIALTVFAYTFMQAAVGTAATDPAPLTSFTAAATASASTGIASSSVADAATSATASSPVVAIPSFYPSRLAIPSIGVDAAVQRVGLNGKDAIGVPSNFTDVAWYEYGAAPGDNGTAIIDGHVDNGLGLDGVFKHLPDVKVGDHIDVTKRDGTQLDFTVTSMNVYDYQQVPIQDLLLSTDAPKLALITCEGGWVSDQRTYNERLVITAQLTSTIGS